MLIKTRIFELCNNGSSYRNLSELARAMGISVSQIYRVREGKRQINQKFIVGAIKTFPDYTLDDLFYLALEPPSARDKAIATGRRRHTPLINRPPKQKIRLFLPG